MELPSYSQQLLQQLYALCTEQCFCDCTIFIGNIHFRAHKVVLAAASLLFKSLLDSTDTISIDASVVTPEEFSLLLEMMYSGKLPLGKHNFTKVISAADSLQMFDVAVSCKNLLRDLISCSMQDQGVRDVSSQAADPSGSRAGANNLPQSGKRDGEQTDTLLPQRAAPFPGPPEAEMAADVSPPGQEVAVNDTWVQKAAMLRDSSSFQEDPGSCPEQAACAQQVGCVAEELGGPPEEKGGARGAGETLQLWAQPCLLLATMPPHVFLAWTIVSSVFALFNVCWAGSSTHSPLFCGTVSLGTVPRSPLPFVGASHSHFTRPW